MVVGDLLGRCAVHFSVEGDDAAERAGGVGGIGQTVGGQGVFRHGHAARVGVFHNHAGCLLKRFHCFPSRIGIGNVVVGQFFALQLAVGRKAAGGGVNVAVKSSLLVRVFAVAHFLHLHPALVELFGKFVHARFAGEFFVRHAGQVIGNHAVILRGVAECFARQVEAGFVGQPAARLLQFADNSIEIGIVGDDGDVFPVFGGGTHHGGAADVDVFNRVFQCAGCFGDGGGKRIQVHAHQIDIADAVFLHFGHVLVQIAAPQNPAVDFRMQRFHAAVQHFGEAGVVGHFNHGDLRVCQ